MMQHTNKYLELAHKYSNRGNPQTDFADAATNVVGTQDDLLAFFLVQWFHLQHLGVFAGILVQI